ncbi:DUF3558 domain-containing protein [Streptomyces sp. NPDC090022]|uniref:DUF3558 domain-containing protein n=1 Tax=Streptomyces sp. NPDC090022 TaxID=3365920 RepID=UPI00380AAD9F
MQRKAAVRRTALPGIALVTALMAAGCTGASGGGGTGDAKAGGATSNPAPAPPGKYRNLPSPCKAVDLKRLKAMLPAADTLTSQQRDQMYAGVADTSYDSDRRVGCRWNAQGPEENRLLHVDFERVVSYDRALTSDDDKAKGVYERLLADAHLPTPAPTAPATPTAPTGSTAPTAPAPTGPTATQAPTTAPASPPAGTPGTPGTPDPTGSPAGATAGATGSAPPPELGSRVLEGLGSAAFLDDKLSAAGAMAQSRSVRIVFRTSNVIVTLEYVVQPSVPGVVPPSGETQDRARQLAKELADRFSD